MTAQAPELAAVVARLEKVERELLAERRRNRRLLAAVGLVIAGMGLAWIVANTPAIAQAQGSNIGPKVIRANQFILEDEKGNARIRLSAIKEAPALALFDENGKLRALLSALKDGLALALYDENGKDRAVLSALKHGPGLSLADVTGKTRAALLVDGGGPMITLLDETGKKAWSQP